MIDKSFFNDFDISIADNFSYKFGFSIEINNYILHLRKDKIEIQIWNDCSSTFYDIKVKNKKLGVFYLLFHKNENLARFNIIDYQKQKSVTEKIKFVFDLIEHDFYELISLDYSKLDTYFFYTDEDYLAYIRKIQNWKSMKTRNLSKLTETKEFQELINNHSIEFFIKDGSILLCNNAIYIYSYMIDGDAEFTLFDINNRTYCFSVSFLISDIMNDVIWQIYNFYDETHIESIINEEIPGEVKMESSFLARIEILKKYFPDLLDGKMEKYEKYFEPLIGGYQKMFDELKIFGEQQAN